MNWIDRYKMCEIIYHLEIKNRKVKVFRRFLADQVVTATANVIRFDWDNALSEVNALTIVTEVGNQYSMRMAKFG